MYCIHCGTHSLAHSVNRANTNTMCLNAVNVRKRNRLATGKLTESEKEREQEQSGSERATETERNNGNILRMCIRLCLYSYDFMHKGVDVYLQRVRYSVSVRVYNFTC